MPREPKGVMKTIEAVAVGALAVGATIQAVKTLKWVGSCFEAVTHNQEVIAHEIEALYSTIVDYSGQEEGEHHEMQTTLDSLIFTMMEKAGDTELEAPHATYQIAEDGTARKIYRSFEEGGEEQAMQEGEERPGDKPLSSEEEDEVRKFSEFLEQMTKNDEQDEN